MKSGKERPCLLVAKHPDSKEDASYIPLSGHSDSADFPEITQADLQNGEIDPSWAEFTKETCLSQADESEADYVGTLKKQKVNEILSNIRRFHNKKN